MKSVSNGVWGNPHQATGGGSSESPPAVFWLQKTLLAHCFLLKICYSTNLYHICSRMDVRLLFFCGLMVEIPRRGLGKERAMTNIKDLQAMPVEVDENAVVVGWSTISNHCGGTSTKID